jgi:uncharacterized protein (UPF0276 family)
LSSGKAPNTDVTLPMPGKPSGAAGIGLRSQHYEELIETRPDIGWLEVHTENFFGGGIHRHYLAKAREIYPVSFHCVGISLGSDQPVDKGHLKQIKELIDIYEPFQVSDHLSWSASGNAHLNDLLPLPYTKETMERVCNNIDIVQNFFERKILLENPSSYVSFTDDCMSEYEFLNEISDKSGCKILLDINNIYVQQYNHGYSARDYIKNIKSDAVEEIHLAGATRRDFEKGSLLVDTHSKAVSKVVWELYEYATKRLGSIPTLIEWDSDIPELDKLIGEAKKAQAIIDNYNEGVVDAA